MGLLAAASLLLSALPLPVATASAILALAYSAWLVRRQWRRESFTLVWAGGDSPVTLNFANRQQSLARSKLSLRGPLASLRGYDEAGRKQIHSWWPDTLPSAARRQFRLLDQVRAKPRVPATVQSIA